MRLVGLTAAVPKTSVLSSAAYDHFPKSEVDRIVGNLGIERHREVMPGQTAMDLCIAAGNGLIDHLKWPRESVDALIVVSQTPDHPMPGSSHRVHKELGMRSSSICFDVTLGCSGFTHGMIIARSFMLSGYAKRVLLVCADTGTHRFHTGIREARRDAELGNAILCGDGAGAVALEADGGPDQWKADAFGADGSGYEHIHIPGGGHKSYWTPELLELNADGKRPVDLTMKGADVFSFTIRRVPPLVTEVLAKAGWSKDDVDVAVFHQANKFIMEFLRKKIGMPSEKVPYSIEEFGNTSSASIPLTMRMRSTHRFDVPTKWLLLGFGAGLSWSGIALETDHIEAAPVVEILMLGGIFPTVLTPWTDADRLDEAALDAQVEDLIGSGVNGLVILGSIGESPLVSEAERDAIIARTIAAGRGRVPVIAGVTALGTKIAVEQVARGRALGLAASLVALPTYYDSSFDRVKEHYLATAAAGPIFYYNYPAATRLRLSHEQIGEIISLPGVVGIKESVFDLAQIAAHIARAATNKYFSVLSGSELDYLDVMRLGGHGAISAGAVVMPRTAVALHRAWLTNDMERAKKLQNQLFEALPCMVDLGSSVAAARLGLQTALKNGKVPEGSVDTTIARLKYALSLRGVPIKAHVRAPLAPLTERDRQAVETAMHKISEIL